MKNLFSAFLAATYLSASLADVYLHAPRGSNNRCDEKSNNRNNDERCFDSENNAAGGYSVADQEMFFYEGTVLPIEWYSQHACGNGAELKDDPNNPESVHCQIILQLGCEPDFAKAAGAASGVYRLTDGISLGRPGADKPEEIAKNPEAVYDTFGDTCTQTQPTTATCAKQNANNDQCNALNLANGGDRGTFNSATCQCSTRKLQTYCNYEPEAYYQKCAARERNKGLFTATQNPNNNGGATKTRQEPNSDRYGFECTEERDYYPYFALTLFRDVAVITTDITKCEYYQTNSQNVVDKCECAAAATATAEEQAKAQFHNQKVPCEAAGYTWKCSGSFNWRKPDCRLSAAQADNALGRIDTRGDNVDEVDGSRMAHYDWLIDSDLIPAGETEVRCQLRLRYNISTGEILDTFDVNDNKKIEQNPVFTVGAANGTAEKTMPLRMAINTAQYGRTFEDRTYVFAIRKRPAELQGKTIHNLNVRGKRGNIAQVRNCVEYDFLPNILNVEPGDYVHFQWAGSDYNANGNAGEGRDGTDRSNIIGVTNYDGNLVTPLNATEKYVQLFNQDDLTTLAWLGQDPKNCYTTTEMLTTKKNNGNDPKSCHFLNGVRNAAGKPTAYFNHIAQVQTTGVFKYISSRNNNFSNRSQKGQIISGGKKSTLNIPLIAGAAAGSVAGVALLAGLGFLVYKKGLPGNSKV